MKKEEISMVTELLELTAKVMSVTEAHISMHISNYGFLVSIGVMENGFREGNGYDGWFNIVSIEDELTEKMALSEFERAKDYLNEVIHKAEMKRDVA